MTVSFHSHGGEVLYTTPPILPRGQASTPSPVPVSTPDPDWECHHRSTTNLAGLRDHDGCKSVTLAECQEQCMATSDCHMVVYHETDNHCHTLSGKDTTRATYEASLQSDSERQTCIHITRTTRSSAQCSSDTDCPPLQFCSSVHSCTALSHTFCDHRPCGLGDGDCDRNSQCSGNLVCGENNCAQFHTHIGSRQQDDGNIPDCCEVSKTCVWDTDCPPVEFCSSFHVCTALYSQYCDYQPCGLGDGDCDRDSQCFGNLVCGKDNCAQFHTHIGSRQMGNGNIPDCCEDGSTVVVHGRNLRLVDEDVSN